MTIDDLKRALVEVKRMCTDRDDCYGCPFELDMTHMHICKLSPQLYSAIPEKWPIDDWKEDGTDEA